MEKIVLLLFMAFSIASIAQVNPTNPLAVKFCKSMDFESGKTECLELAVTGRLTRYRAESDSMKLRRTERLARAVLLNIERGRTLDAAYQVGLILDIATR